MTGNGLQGTLLSLRAQMENFPVAIIGIVMSLYYCGYLGGWYIVPRMIKSVGHIRVFAAFASMASTTVLLHGLFLNPFIWSGIRILSGFSFMALFIVAESWLNNIAPNKLRGRIFGAYLFIVHGGLFTGQFFINIAPITGMGLFVLISVLVSLSLMPITLANKPSPGYQEPEHLPFINLFKISPLSVASVLTSGFTSATVLTLGPVHAQQIGFSTVDISLFIAFYVLGAGSIPIFFGWLSDKVDRRKVIIAIAFCGLCLCALAANVNGFFTLIMFLLGGIVTSLYSIGVAFLNDRLTPGQMTSATASMILIAGIGACIGPIITGILIENLGTNIFFLVFTVPFFALVTFAILREFTGPKIKLSGQRAFVALPARSGPTAAHFDIPKTGNGD